MHRVIRAYGGAFEYLAANASATFAMGWLQPVFEEYRSRGMMVDADRVMKAYTGEKANTQPMISKVFRLRSLCLRQSSKTFWLRSP